MNIVDFFSEILKTNKDFDETQINRYIAYFLDQTKNSDQHLMLYLKENINMFNKHLEDLIEHGIDSTNYEHSHIYGFDGLTLRAEYDADGNLIATNVITDENFEKSERLVFRAEGLKIWSIKEDDYLKVFYKGVAICEDNNGKRGLINKFGEILTPPYYDFITTPPIGDYLVVSKNGKYGVIDFKGNEVVPLIYEDIISESDYEIAYTYTELYGFAYDYLILHKDGKYGLMNKDLKIIFPVEYKVIYSFQKYFNTYREQTYFILENDDSKFAIYHPKEKLLKELNWDEVYTGRFCQLIPFRQGKRKGFYNIKTKKETFVHFDFDLSAFNDNFKDYIQIKSKASEKYAVFDSNLNRLTKFALHFPADFTFQDKVYLFINGNSFWGVGTSISKKEFFKLYGRKSSKKL